MTANYGISCGIPFSQQSSFGAGTEGQVLSKRTGNQFDFGWENLSAQRPKISQHLLMPNAITQSNVAVSAGVRHAIPIEIPAGGARFDGIAIHCATGAVGAVARLGLYSARPSDGYPNQLIFDAGTVTPTANNTQYVATFNTITIPSGLYYGVCWVTGANPTITTTGNGQITPFFPQTVIAVATIIRQGFEQTGLTTDSNLPAQFPLNVSNNRSITVVALRYA